MTHELGLSFRSEVKTLPVIRETAQRYGMQTDFIGVYDDLGDLPLTLPLYEAACNLPKGASTRLGAVGFAVPKYPSMVDIAGYVTTLGNLLQDPHRVITGLVPGAWMQAIGLQNASVQQMREAAESLQYLLRKDTAGYDGKFYNIASQFELNYPTDATVPLLMGTWGEKMAALAGEIADEIKVGGSANPEMVDVMRRRLEIGARVAGRPLQDIGIALGAVTIVDEDGAKAREVAKRKAAIYIDVIGSKDPTAMADFPNEIIAIQQAVRSSDIEAAVRYMPDELARRFVIAGTPEDVVRHTRDMLDAGASRVEFGTPHGIGDSAEDELRGVQLLVERVFPYFR